MDVKFYVAIYVLISVGNVFCYQDEMNSTVPIVTSGVEYIETTTNVVPRPEESVYEEFADAFAKIAEQLKAWDKEFGAVVEENSTNDRFKKFMRF